MDEDIDKKVVEVKLKINLSGRDLDIQAFELIEADIKRPLTQHEKAYIRYLLDQDEQTRDAWIHKTDYADGELEKWK